jgi:drug/metabolite transporter (DMT)-like permease
LGLLPTRRQLIGVLGGLACMWLIVDDGVDRGMTLGFLALTLWIPISSALSNTVIKRTLPKVPAVPLTAMMLAFSGLWLAPLSISPATMNALHLAAPASLPIASPTMVTWVQLFVLTVVATGLSTAAFVWMILVRGPLFAGMTTYVVPVLALLWGSIDNETINPQQLAAIAGVLSMVAMVQYRSPRPIVGDDPLGAVPNEPTDAIDEAMQPCTPAADATLAVEPISVEILSIDPRVLASETRVA